MGRTCATNYDSKYSNTFSDRFRRLATTYAANDAEFNFLQYNDNDNTRGSTWSATFPATPDFLAQAQAQAKAYKVHKNTFQSIPSTSGVRPISLWQKCNL